MPKMPTDFKSKIAKATLPERSVKLCLNGALRAEYDDLEIQLASMTNSGAARLGGNPQAGEIARRMADLRDEMTDSEIVVRLRGLNHRRWVEMLTEHAPRKDNDGDQSVGFNQQTFYAGLVREAIVDPEMDDDDFSGLVDALNSRQWDELVNAAWTLNRGEVSVPFSVLASEILRKYGETSKQPPASESRPAGSKDGNRKPRRATSTTTPAT